MVDELCIGSIAVDKLENRWIDLWKSGQLVAVWQGLASRLLPPESSLHQQMKQHRFIIDQLIIDLMGFHPLDQGFIICLASNFQTD